METNAKIIEELLEKVTEYGKTSFELVKLKALDKTSDVVSSIVPHSFVIIIFSAFLLFTSLGASIWLGEILGKAYFGFFVVAAFYGIVGLILHFFLHTCLKKKISNSIIKQILN